MGEYLLTLPALLEAVPASAAGPRRVGGLVAGGSAAGLEAAAAAAAAAAAGEEERDEASVFAEQWMVKARAGLGRLTNPVSSLSALALVLTIKF